jgi:hypothetical protein
MPNNDELAVIVITDACQDCGAPTLGICDTCEQPICMECYRHYEWALVSTQCWKCRAERDQEWLKTW